MGPSKISGAGDPAVVVDVKAFQPLAVLFSHVNVRAVAGIVADVPAKTVEGILNMIHNRIQVGQRLYLPGH
ncbi:MAG: hypothetical protein HFG72_04685 [Hungatella sp.]|nr:hypothetical protein [Hungatella sp.]